MNVLFLTTYNVDIDHEHFFTKNVWNALSNFKFLKLGSVLFSMDITKSQIQRSFNNQREYYKLIIPYIYKSNDKYIINSIIELFKIAESDIVHSNMIEGYDIQAAKFLNIPIFITIHIGGFICPRGGGNGFLMYNDTICNQKIGKICMKCGCMDLPLSYISYFLLNIFPKPAIKYISNKIKNKNIFYVTPFINKYNQILNRKKYIDMLKYANIIAANKRLVDLLVLNCISEKNIKLLPHGVKNRVLLAFPEYRGKVIFYYLGRIQYSKGLHILMKAFDGIDNSKYELHVIGDAEKARKELRYEEHIKYLAKGKNIIFHRRLPNNEIESVIKNCHIMIHSTICLEIYGISISESLSLGRPVLATKCGGAEMQIIDNYNGWLVEPNSVIEMKKKIEHIINNFSEVHRLHLNSKNPNTIEDYTSKLVDFYKYEYNNK